MLLVTINLPSNVSDASERQGENPKTAGLLSLEPEKLPAREIVCVQV